VHSNWPEPIITKHLVGILEIVRSERGNLENYDVVECGETSGTDSSKDARKLKPWMDVGATWWLEVIHDLRAGIYKLRERIRAGPPVIEA
jgi:hypothetical protein